jgi:hypothetical protein
VTKRIGHKMCQRQNVSETKRIGTKHRWEEHIGGLKTSPIRFFTIYFVHVPKIDVTVKKTYNQEVFLPLDYMWIIVSVLVCDQRQLQE